MNICKDCLIGAGATVCNNLLVSGKYIGTPAVIKQEKGK